jgi:hypothetical protein
MNTCYTVRSSRPAALFSFGLLDGLPVRLPRPYVREAPAGFGLERLAMAFMNNPGQVPILVEYRKGLIQHPKTSGLLYRTG